MEEAGVEEEADLRRRSRRVRTMLRRLRRCLGLMLFADCEEGVLY